LRFDIANELGRRFLIPTSNRRQDGKKIFQPWTRRFLTNWQRWQRPSNGQWVIGAGRIAETTLAQGSGSSATVGSDLIYLRPRRFP